MNEKELIQKHLQMIKRYSEKIDKEINIMEVCGGHTNVIMRYGIREKIPKNIRLISGPGCPVCVSSQRDIDCIIKIAKSGVPIATYGDMLRVPGSESTLEDLKAEGAKIFEVYSTTEVLELRKRYPDIIFFGVGFETTAPMSAFLLENDVCVYSVHKTMPNALETLANEGRIDGFILPGHVSTVIGTKPYEKITIAQVVAGFTAERLLRAISLLVKMIAEGNKGIVNAYPEVVKPNGNEKIQILFEKNFKISDSEWRGLGFILGSGLEVKNDKLNAKIKYKDIISKIEKEKKSACRCGEVLKGLIKPGGCPLYKTKCTPDSPQGACMVSAEGSCAIYYNYGK